jgi:diguanylate cyclase (GGDEF)-like protein
VEEISRSSTASAGCARAQKLLAEGLSKSRRGLLADSLELLGEAYHLFRDGGRQADALEALLALARAERELGRLDRAAEHIDEALSSARTLGDVVAEADALNLRGGVFCARGDYIGALEHLELGLALAQRAGALERQANILSNIGGLHTQLGNHPRALECLQSARQLVRAAAPGGKSEAVNLLGLGRLYFEMGDTEAAHRHAKQALSIGRQAGETLIEHASLNLLANLCCRMERWQEAQTLFSEALALVRDLGIRHCEVDNLDGLGQVQAALALNDRAIDSFEEALALAREIEDREGEIDALVNLGRVHLAIGRAEEAYELVLRGLELAERADRKRSQFEAHQLLSQFYERSSDLAAALHHEREFHRLEKSVFYQESEQRSSRLAVHFELARAEREAEAVRMEAVQQSREQAEELVRSQTRELEEAQREIVNRLAAAAEYRDDETGEHTWRVAEHSAAIARVLGWAEPEVALLSSAARLHDIGKIGIPDAVLMKQGRLSPSEFDVVRSHTLIGARILEGAESAVLRLAQEIALAHHERWDGQGYPLGLEGNEIPLPARIVAVADVLDALTHERPYKRAWQLSEGLAEIVRGSGLQFDPQVVAACLEAFTSEGVAVPVGEAPAGAGGTGDGEASERAQVVGLGRRFEQILANRTRELENARREAESRVKRLQVMAYSDPLTGLANRRAFEQDLSVEVVRARRHGSTLAVLSLDLDALKSVNDSEGHERGDELLKSFSAEVSAQLRQLGRIYRIGGDEFAAILPHVGLSDRESVLARLECAVAQVRNQGFLNVASSAGMAVFPDEASSPGELTRLSDQRMYRDKQGRRDQANRSHAPNGRASSQAR